ncbi:MAG: hypothetical protein JWN11_636 [Hyphomicrobiales bacterium]|nr:hypothetical protein [Hyphomicrobiales bacterium]
MTALRDNRAELVSAAVAGRVAPARIHAEAMASDDDGRIRLLPGTGGIALGVHAGDRAANWLADHLVPGASIEDADGTPAAAGPLHLLSCIGNRVRDAAGRGIGIVAGKRGGLAPGFWAPQLVGVEISDAVAARLNPEDRIIVETVGRGLKLLDHPEITLANLSPRLLDALPLTQANGALACAVCAIVPPEAAGAGLGQDSWVGDLEITDERCLAGSVADLHFGDMVAFADIDSNVSRFYRPGMASIGIVSHGPGHAPGHGIGVTILLTGPAERLIASIGQGGMGATLREWSESLLE